jgi:hypothetical protein
MDPKVLESNIATLEAKLAALPKDPAKDDSEQKSARMRYAQHLGEAKAALAGFKKPVPQA